jgi:hypothetical protein
LEKIELVAIWEKLWDSKRVKYTQFFFGLILKVDDSFSEGLFSLKPMQIVIKSIF